MRFAQTLAQFRRPSAHSPVVRIDDRASARATVRTRSIRNVDVHHHVIGKMSLSDPGDEIGVFGPRLRAKPSLHRRNRKLTMARPVMIQSIALSQKPESPRA